MNVTFTFTDSDSDGYYPVANGGTDCNDSDAIMYQGASCTRSGYTGSTYDSVCVCWGGTVIGGGGNQIINPRKFMSINKIFIKPKSDYL